MTTQESNYWLNAVIDRILEEHPEGELIVSSGISPSASYHIGHFREILSADILRWGIEQRGRKVRHLHVVDNFDPLRKRYEFLPEDYEQYVGWPVCLVPDPTGTHASYADYYFEEFHKWMPVLNIEAEVVKSYEDLYKTGRMAPQIEKAVAGAATIRQIFKDVANRDLPDDWMPLQLLSDNNSFNEWRYVGIDTDNKTIHYRDEAGNEGDVPYDSGRVKLNWRLDWPARWQLLNVDVEPYGKEHATKGGSYDTGAEFVRQVFGGEPPFPVPYDTINLIGHTKKMSSSLGNLITPEQALSIMPPEVLRYIYARYPVRKLVEFDPGLGHFRLMDEFTSVDAAVRRGEHPQFEEPYQLAVSGLTSPGMVEVPFNHLVSIYQAARGDETEIKHGLERTGYGAVLEQEAALQRELEYVRVWLEEYAPAELKFELQENLPEVELSDNQRQLLAKLAELIEGQAENELDGNWFHNAVHEAREAAGLSPGEAFQAIYRILLNQDSGPKAGWFLSSLDRYWLVQRLKAASGS